VCEGAPLAVIASGIVVHPLRGVVDRPATGSSRGFGNWRASARFYPIGRCPAMTQRADRRLFAVGFFDAAHPHRAACDLPALEAVRGE